MYLKTTASSQQDRPTAFSVNRMGSSMKINNNDHQTSSGIMLCAAYVPSFYVSGVANRSDQPMTFASSGHQVTTDEDLTGSNANVIILYHRYTVNLIK